MEVSANNSQAILNNQQNTDRNRGEEKQVAEIVEQQAVSRQDQATSAQPLAEASSSAEAENRNNQQIDRQAASAEESNRPARQPSADETLGSQIDISV